MQNDRISMHQVICMIILFLFGSSVLLGMGIGAGGNTWIAVMAAAILGSILSLVYARLIRLFPEQNFYDIAQLVFGKVIGKIITVLMMWYAIHLAALVLRNFSEFINIVTLEETPQIVVMIAILSVTGYMVVSGIETFAKWVMFAIIFVIMVFLFTIALSIKDIEISHILPMLTYDFSTIGSTTLKLFIFPFAETVLFLTLADSIKKKDNPYKIYLYGIFLGTLLLAGTFLRNLMILGHPMLERSYFPSYMATRILNIAEIFSRIEVTIFYNFLLAGITKISICLFASIKGAEKLFNTSKNWKMMCFISLIVLLLSRFQFKNLFEMLSFIDLYQYYAVFFQIIIPLFVWIGAEIKIYKNNKASIQ